MVGKQKHRLSSTRDDMVTRRTRIGHTYLTYKYFMMEEDQLLGNECNELLTVKHILLDCSMY